MDGSAKLRKYLDNDIDMFFFQTWLQHRVYNS